MIFPFPASAATLPSLPTSTISGHLYYNDLRINGLFSSRTTPPSRFGHVKPGTQLVSSSSTPTIGLRNYLGALDVTVKLFEIDHDLSGSGCVKKDLIGEATVQPDGSFSFVNVHMTDPCSSESGNPEIAIKFVLSFSNNKRNFSVHSAEGVAPKLWGMIPLYPFFKWHPAASPGSPRELTSALTSLDDAFLETSASPGDPDDTLAQASNVFASLVDSTRVWHEINNVPFGKDEVITIYPSQLSPAKNAGGKIHIPRETSWFNGRVLMHEYGHMIWDRTPNIGDCGDACPGGQYMRDENPKWNNESREYPFTSFREGWANFSRRAVENSCDEIDENTYPNQIVPIRATDHTQGKAYAGNVTKFLCDWYDDQNDDDPSLTGPGDKFSEKSLLAMRENLSHMYLWSGVKTGLNVCDYMNYYLEVRMKPSMSNKDFNILRDKVIALGNQNAIECGGSISTFP